MRKNIKELYPYVIIVVVVILVRTFIITPVIVSGSSMKPNFNDGELLLVRKIRYNEKTIKRFDVVVIKKDKEEIIKRVIGLPGEHISYKNNKLYVNDKVLEENFDFRKTNDFNLEEICSCNSIPEGKYLVLGDNRPISKDSRMIGLIDEKDILGKRQAIIIHSMMGNGKTVLLKQLAVDLCSKGRVFFLDDINSYIQDDLDYLSEQKGLKFIFVDNYTRIIDSEYARVLSNCAQSGMKFIFSVRSYMYDNSYHRFTDVFNIEANKIDIYNINMMNSNEQNRMLELLDTYSLWGKKAALTRQEKKKYISRKCHGEIKNIMLDLLNSQKAQKDIKELLEVLFNSQDVKEIILLSFICEIIDCNVTLDEIVLLLGKQARTASILKNVQINEFLDFDNNRLKLKSSAEYILHNMDYNDDVELIVSKIILVLNAHNHISRYEHMLRMIVSYSNLRMLFNRKEKSYSERITKIYEIAKSLEYFKENPFFWLQYAIAKMEVHDYQAAQIYLDNAESFRKKKHVTDSWQIDTIKGRFLLEKTMYDNNAKYAYENFDMAYHYLHDNNTTDIQYPLRQVSLFDKYYRQFYDGFSNSERNVFLMHCIDMQKLIKKNISSVGKMNTRELIRIDKMLTKIQNEMAKKSV